MPALTSEQADAFLKEGYLVFERFFHEEETARFKADIDELEARRKQGERIQQPLSFPNLGPLIHHPRVMETVEGVMGPGFHFHHLHAVRQDAGAPGVPWHQDYVQAPQTNRAHVMVHLFYYFNGLNGEIGDLLVLPRSQNRVVNNDALWHLGEEDLPGSLVVNDLPPGSAVLVHSALWHARRKKAGGENTPRYFADASYCQAGVRWPGYRSNYVSILAEAKEMGLDGCGKYPALLDPDAFFDETAAASMARNWQGSMILDTHTWQSAEQAKRE